MVEVMNMKRFFLTHDGRKHSRLIELDSADRTARVDGEYLPVTGQEFSLLWELCTHASETLSRESILRNAWGFRAMGVTRTVDVHVQKLRKKLGSSTIETVYRCGYRLCAEAL